MAGKQFKDGGLYCPAPLEAGFYHGDEDPTDWSNVFLTCLAVFFFILAVVSFSTQQEPRPVKEPHRAIMLTVNEDGNLKVTDTIYLVAKKQIKDE